MNAVPAPCSPTLTRMSLPMNFRCLALAGIVFSLVLCSSVQSFAATDAEEWTKLTTQRDQIVAKLKMLQQSFRTAESEEEKMKIAQEFEKARQAFITDVIPKISKLAPKVFAADPKNTDAGEAALEMAFQENRYEEAVKLSDQLIAGGDQSLIVQNMGGISLFALHEFAKAHDLLAAAEKEGQLHPQLGGRYLDSSLEYQELWKKEQEIRKAEAALTGDRALPQVKFETTKGPILFELFEDQAPNTVANFVSLVESKTYDGVKFHRVIPTFMAQGGDPLSKDEDPENDGTGGPGYVIDCECYREDARMHFRGSLSMAHAGKDSGGSQFFITHLPTAHLNVNREEERGHTVFGRIVEGFDVAAALTVGDEIKSAKVVRKRNHPYQPKKKPDPRGN